jgi:hypothetical protein
MNKNDNSEDDDYYKQFNFLNKSKQEINSEVKVVKDIPRMKNVMTVDQQRNQALDINAAVKSVMEENSEINASDSLVMRKSEGQKMIESPELNKKLRTQIDYREAMKGNQTPKKTIQDEITFNQSNIDFLKTKEEKNKIIYNEMKKYQFKNAEVIDINENKEKEIKEIAVTGIMNKENNQSPIESSIDSKLKVYKIKKKKTASESQESTISNNPNFNKEHVPREETVAVELKPPQQIKKQETITKKSYLKFLPYVYTSSIMFMGSFILFKLYKKLKIKK